MSSKFLESCTEDERREQMQTVDYADTNITTALLDGIKHVFGVHGARVFDALGAPAVSAEIRSAIEHAVAMAYQNGARDSFNQCQDVIGSLRMALADAAGRQVLAQLGPLEPFPVAPSDSLGVR